MRKVIMVVTVLIVTLIVSISVAKADINIFYDKIAEFTYIKDDGISLFYCHTVSNYMPTRFGHLNMRLVDAGIYMERQYSYGTFCMGVNNLFEMIGDNKEDKGRYLLMLSDTNSDFMTAAVAFRAAKDFREWNSIATLIFLFEYLSGPRILESLKAGGVTIIWTPLKRNFFRALVENRPADAYALLQSERINTLLGTMESFIPFFKKQQKRSEVR